MFKTILLPHDFSASALRAEGYAAQMARTLGSRIVLCHVSDLPGLDVGALFQPEGERTPAKVEEYVVRTAKERLEVRAKELRAKGITVTCRACMGDVAPAILKEADEIGADVIVMGTHGRKGLAHLLLGSVAEKVIREARVPVLTVRYAEDEGVVETDEETAMRDEMAG